MRARSNGRASAASSTARSKCSVASAPAESNPRKLATRGGAQRAAGVTRAHVSSSSRIASACAVWPARPAASSRSET